MRPAIVAALALLGCSGGAPQTLPTGAVRQIELAFSTASVRRVIVLVVDDSPTPEATFLRAEVTRALRPAFEALFRDSGYRGAFGDPAALPPADLRVVVVHPSSASASVGGSRVVGPSREARLALVSERTSIAQVDALADAAGDVIAGFVASADAPYALLDAAGSTLDLVVGARQPAGGDEADLVASLGNPEVISLVMMTSRDDGGTGAIPVVLGALDPRVGSTAIASPVVRADLGCGGQLEPSTRMAKWVSWIAPAKLLVVDAKCQALETEWAQSGFFDWLFLDYSFEWCMPAPWVTRAADEAACVIEVTMEDDGACASHRGMLDPLDGDGVRRPRAGVRAGEAIRSRVCEVTELLGSEASACRQTVDCSGCGAGWCATDVWGHGSCPNALKLRFVQGALPRARAVVRVVCDLNR
ncbi:MAG: hypothetical protein M3O36_19445 [Myxococcota bacterium]|nr:hypothetical protein [Myxococcota bacterium]